jgi:hypothetical protein
MGMNPLAHIQRSGGIPVRASCEAPPAHAETGNRRTFRSRLWFLSETGLRSTSRLEIDQVEAEELALDECLHIML